MKYRCIDRHRKQYPIRMMCRALNVSRSGYYAWLNRPESQRAQQDRILIPLISQIHSNSKGTYGAPRVQAELKAQGYHYGVHKISRLMRLADIKGIPKRRFKVARQTLHNIKAAKNLLQQDFTTKAPNQRWVADITYIPTYRGMLYLAIVMDLYSRRIVG